MQATFVAAMRADKPRHEIIEQASTFRAGLQRIEEQMADQFDPRVRSQLALIAMGEVTAV